MQAGSVFRTGNVFQFSDTKYVTFWTIPSPNKKRAILTPPPFRPFGQSGESGTVIQRAEADITSLCLSLSRSDIAYALGDMSQKSGEKQERK
jgi:hypothetical protein